MSLSLQFDEGNVIEDFTIVLSKRNHEHYGEIANVKRDTINCKVNMNAADEISFDIYKYVLDESGNKRDERLWNQIVDFRLIWIKELDEYFEINVTLDDSTENVVKSIVGTSLCEAELSQTNLYDIEINTENDIARDDYVVTKFYDKDNQKASLLHRVLNKNPGYTIKHVDKSLVNLQRSFSIDGTSVYDFLTGECSEQFNCLFQFDSTDRSISVYDLYTVCGDCGYRGEYEHICPECGSENLYYYGEDTTIYVDKTNLTDEIQITMDAGSVKNCFKLVAGDDYMTSVIRDLNQNGSDYIYYITEDQKKDMPSELVEKIESYDELYASYTAEYEQLIQDIYDTLDGIYYYKHEMMPTVEHAEVTAKTEADKLNQVNMGYLALSSVTSSTSKATVESGLKNYAKVYVKTGFVKVEINQSTYTFKNKGNATWVGNFKVTNYSDDEDIAYSPIITVTIDDNYEIFLKQKIQKKIASENDKEGTVFDVLNIDELSDFKEALKLYCLERLKSFYDAIQAALDILVEVDQSSEAADFYSSIYVPYYNKLKACQSEMDVRQKTVDELDARYKELVNRKNKIQKTLNFNEYLGEELYTTFCAYRREDKYTNSNYISDGMENSELIENGKKFIEFAKKELYKSAQKQYTLSSSIHNLLVMPEFKAIKNKFELGNWIRFCADEMLYRLRLISINIQFSDEKKLDVDFSSLTKQIDCMSDVKDVIQSAQSMSSSYSYVAKQAEKGNEANNSLSYLRENGLNSALIDIKNNTDEEITYGKNGLLARSYDDILDDYSPEQFKLTHNIMAYTNDNWNSVKMALGKMKYKLDGKTYEEYGVNADTLIGGKMISGDIYSLNYNFSTKKGAHINLNNGDFTLANGKIAYNNSDNKLTMKGVTIEWSSSTSPDISDIDNLDDRLGQLDGRIQTYSQETQPTWEDADENHDKDVWLNTKTGVTYIYNASTNKWIETNDSTLKDLAKSKAKIFTTTPTPPYQIGDMWVEGVKGDIKHCITTRTSGNYVASDWAKSSKYTDDSSLNNFVTGQYKTDLEGIGTKIDGKTDTFYQNAKPHTEHTAVDDSASYNLWVGDLWYDTTNKKSFRYHKSNSTTSGKYDYKWVEIDGVPDDVYDQIDGKKAIYTSLPKKYNVDDMYILEEDRQKDSKITWEKGTILVCKTARTTSSTIFEPSHWEDITKYTDDKRADAAYELAENLNFQMKESKEDMNELKQALGATYIDDKMIFSPTIKGGQIEIKSTNGTTSAKISNNGVLTATGAEITGTINATSGALGGWDLTSTAIKTKDVAITSNNAGSIGLSTSNFTRTIGGTSRTGLRFAIGSNFGVHNNGTVYANNVSISGTISSSTISGGTIGIGNGNFVVDSNGNLTAKKATISGKITGSIIEGSSFIANADQETPKIIVGDQEDGGAYRTEIYCDRIDHILRGGTYKVSLDGYGVSFFESGVRKYSLNFLNDRIQIRDVYSDYVQTKKIVSETIQESFKGYAMCGIDKGHTYHCHWNGSSLQLQVDSTWIWNSSDKRLKKNIKSISEEYIDAIGSVDLVQYNLNRENFSDKELYFGTIAQDVVEELKLRGLNDDNIKLLTKQKQSENDDVFYYGMDYEQFLILRVAYDEERINKLERIIEKIK